MFNCYYCGHNTEDDSGDIIEFTVEELNAYTDVFSERKFIGRGAFGPVYHGIIYGRNEKNVNGQYVAVKFSRDKAERARTQWQAEVQYLPRVQHQNIIKLIGYCETQERFYLVYPFMQNGTLTTKLSGLDWRQTLKIIKGVAGAIQKLQDHVPPLIHRDLKLDNILLDKDFNPKLSDFGNVTSEGDHIESGTKAHDIFSFGVMVLQLIMKEKKSYGIGCNWNISDSARAYSANSIELVHAKLTSTGCSRQAAKPIAELGLDCVNPKPSERPTISQVLNGLENL